MNPSYIDDNESALSVDVEGVSDSAAHSKLALFAILPLIIGLLAPIEPRLAFFSGAAVLMASLALFFARREPLASVSTYIALAIVFIGAITTVWGFTNQQMKRARLFKQATNVAQLYMDTLADNNMIKAIQLVGLDPAVQRDIDKDTQSVQNSQKAVRSYLEDYALKQIVTRGKEAKWVPQGIINHTLTFGEYQFIVRFKDESRTNQSPYDVVVLYSPPPKNAAELVDRWMIDRVEEGK